MPIKKRTASAVLFRYGAGKESRTLDLNLGKVALYQLSYSRINRYCLFDIQAMGLHIRILEARAGVEPTYSDLQSGT